VGVERRSGRKTRIWARLAAAVLIAIQTALWATPLEAAPPAQPPAQESTVVHVVHWGETLFSIARRYHTTIEAIAEANDIVDPRWIKAGQRLVVPTTGDPAPPPAKIHIVQSGETLTGIARRYGTTVSAIATANYLVNPSLILVGQRLVIPGLAQSAPLPLPFIAVEINPRPVIQGQTLAIKVRTSEPINLAGSFDHKPLIFVGEGSHYWALVGIGAIAPTGPYLLELSATEGPGKTAKASELIQVVAIS